MSDSEEERMEKQLKVAFLGDVNIGKTSIIKRFCQDEFTRQYTPTAGADFYTKHLILPGSHEVTLIISDIGGGELKGSMLDKYLYNVNIVVLVFDITSASSFDSLPLWIDAVSELIVKPTLTAVLGNKCDLEHQRAIRLDKTQQLMKQYNLQSCMVSARTGECLNASLMELVAKYLGIKLTKMEKEHHQPVVRAELVPPSPVQKKPPAKAAHKRQASSSVCSVQ